MELLRVYFKAQLKLFSGSRPRTTNARRWVITSPRQGLTKSKYDVVSVLRHRLAPDRRKNRNNIDTVLAHRPSARHAPSCSRVLTSHLTLPDIIPRGALGALAFHVSSMPPSDFLQGSGALTIPESFHEDRQVMV